MNFFEHELRKLLADENILDNATFVGRVCYGDIGKDLRARIQFAASNVADHYSSLSVTIFNRTERQVDQARFNFKDILGQKPVPGNSNFPQGVSPHIWEYRGDAEWYAYKPTQADYRKIQQSLHDYIDVFRPREERTMEQGENTISVKTKMGEIVAGVKSDPDYPGIYIDLTGPGLNAQFEKDRVGLAWVEFTPDKDKIQTIVYGDGNLDDFTNLIEHKNLFSREQNKSSISEQSHSVSSDKDALKDAPEKKPTLDTQITSAEKHTVHRQSTSAVKNREVEPEP